ncbi:hypothetical protein LguiB_035640 [Lonicera macranthoides]
MAISFSSSSSILMRLIYPPPPSLYVTAMSVVTAASLINAGIMEIKGKHMQYSKFLNVAPKSSSSNNSYSGEQQQQKISSRTGMLVLYTPAFLAGVASFALFPVEEDLRFKMLCSALTLHFFKRVFEVSPPLSLSIYVYIYTRILCTVVIFVHKYSGSMAVEAVFPISLSYFFSTATMIYAQYLTLGLPEPPVDLKYAGVAIFLAGILGNFYHHFILSNMRNGDKEYKIPRGGLFNLVICPHYLFEILGFLGASCISQTLYAFSFTLGTTGYLIGRSYATRKWYLSKFEDFPKDVKALIPFIF